MVLAAAERGETAHFRLIPARLDEAARRVADITRRRYPDLAVPYHSRWRHFSAGGVDRAALVAPGAGRAEAVRARIDLTFVSVLLDAGAGARWRFHEAETGRPWSRSEGLAVASLRAMQSGLFSADPADLWRADAEALSRLSAERLAEAFQHSGANEVLGIEARTALLRRLGEVCADRFDLFGKPPRPGNLFDYWSAGSDKISAPEILRFLLEVFGPIWPSPFRLAGLPLGDCGRHPAVAGHGLVPFHKLSQWLAYSLVEPLEAAGLRVTDLDGLTGLAEYRNGGLFVDCGVIELRDRLAAPVRERLGKTPREFPLACVLEGGSWAAGREIAFERRPDGSAPLA